MISGSELNHEYGESGNPGAITSSFIETEYSHKIDREGTTIKIGRWPYTPSPISVMGQDD
jgi:hypothetical protein